MPSSDSAASRRKFLQAALTTGGAAALYPCAGRGPRDGFYERFADPRGEAFELEEITIPELQDGMKSGKFTARSLVEKYLGAHRGDRYSE